MSDELTSGPEEEVPADEKTAKENRLTPAQWAEIVNHYELGTMSGADMAKKYVVSPSALSQYFKRHNIIKGSKAHLVAAKTQAEIAAAAAKSAATFANLRAERIEKVKTEIYKSQTAVQALNMRVVQKIADGTISGAEAIAQLKALRLSAAISHQTLESRYVVLDAEGHTDEDSLPELKVKDLSQAEIESYRDQDDDDSELIVETPEMGEIGGA